MTTTRRGFLAGVGAASVVAAVGVPAIVTAAHWDACHITHERHTPMARVCSGWIRADDKHVYARALIYTDLDVEDFGGLEAVQADVENQIRAALTGVDREMFLHLANDQVFLETWDPQQVEDAIAKYHAGVRMRKLARAAKENS